MKHTLACVLLVLSGLAADVAHAQFGVPWHNMPKIAVISAEGDARLGLVDDAVSFWNRTLEDIGSGFRLGPVERFVQPLPEAALQSLSSSVLGATRGA